MSLAERYAELRGEGYDHTGAVMELRLTDEAAQLFARNWKRAKPAPRLPGVLNRVGPLGLRSDVQPLGPDTFDPSALSRVNEAHVSAVVGEGGFLRLSRSASGAATFPLLDMRGRPVNADGELLKRRRAGR